MYFEILIFNKNIIIIEVNIDANQKNIRKIIPFKFDSIKSWINKKEIPTNETTMKEIILSAIEIIKQLDNFTLCCVLSIVILHKSAVRPKGIKLENKIEK